MRLIDTKFKADAVFKRLGHDDSSVLFLEIIARVDCLYARSDHPAQKHILDRIGRVKRQNDQQPHDNHASVRIVKRMVGPKDFEELTDDVVGYFE